MSRLADQQFGPQWRMRAADARITFDPTAGAPLHRQVQEFLWACLQTGVFPLGRPLPSTRYLAADLGVSRNTVVLAYQELTALGTIESRPRSGFFPTRQGSAVAVTSNVRGVEWQSHLIARSPELSRSGPTHADWTKYPYPLIPGQPDLKSFPVRAWSRALSRALDGTNLSFSLRDSVDVDDPLLVHELCQSLLPVRGIRASPEEVLIINGAQQGLDLLARTMLTFGRGVAMENPGYLDAYQIFRRSAASVRLVDWMREPVDDLLAHEFDLLYVTPSHQHPTTVTMPYATRQALLRAADDRDFLIVEDDFDSEMRYSGKPTPALKSLDVNGRVIHIGTFSKFVAPGIRLGFLVADAPLIEAMRAERRHEVKHPAGLLQRALGLYIASGDYQSALRHQRYQLQRKWVVTKDALQRHLPWSEGCAPAGGASFWLTGPAHLDCDRLEREALRRGVLIDSGSHFYYSEHRPKRSFRLGITACPLEAIPEAIRILGQLCRAQGAG